MVGMQEIAMTMVVVIAKKNMREKKCGGWVGKSGGGDKRNGGKDGRGENRGGGRELRI